MEKKYQILYDQKQNIVVDGRRVTVYRIQALRDINVQYGTDVVKEGDFGGYVEKPENLSQDGECWVSDMSAVFDNATVSKNAYVCGRSYIYGNAKVTDHAFIGHGTDVCGDAEIGRFVMATGKRKIQSGRYYHQGDLIDRFK